MFNHKILKKIIYKKLNDFFLFFYLLLISLVSTGCFVFKKTKHLAINEKYKPETLNQKKFLFMSNI